MLHAGFLRNFQDVIRLLREAGVDVRVHFSKAHESIRAEDYELESEGTGALEITTAQAVPDTAQSLLAQRVRLARDVVHYARPQFRTAAHLRGRFVELQKEPALAAALQTWVGTLSEFDGRLTQVAGWWLDGLERRIPPPEALIHLIDEYRPDLVMVTPLVNFNSREIDLVKAARQRNIPTMLAVASWDNLTNKGVLKVQPDYVAVWNQAMADEATTLHGVPTDRLWITGAPMFDQWFTRAPSRDRTTFCRMLGLKSDRPLVVYLCSSRSMAGTAEYLVVKDWTNAIRSSDDPLLAGASVLVRPHPMELHGWTKMLPKPMPEVAWRNGAAIWPTNPKHPTTEAGRDDFFDTIYHADAIVGLNTSAMIEAAILETSVLTFFGHGMVASQTGNLHFQHLAGHEFMRQGRDLAEHVRQLAAVLHAPRNGSAATRDFVTKFVRPLGHSVSAAGSLVDRILDVLGRPPEAHGHEAPQNAPCLP